MIPRTICGIVAFSLGILLAPLAADAQQPPRTTPRIGYLGGAFPAAVSARTEAFRQRLRELGYVEGKTLSLSGDLQREK